MMPPMESHELVTVPDTAVTIPTDSLGTVHVTHGPFRGHRRGEREGLPAATQHPPGVGSVYIPGFRLHFCLR